MKYSSKWKTILNGLEIKEEEHKAFLGAHASAFEAITLYLKREEAEIQKIVFSKKNYDKSNWSYRQADFNGQLRQLDDLLKLLEG